MRTHYSVTAGHRLLLTAIALIAYVGRSDAQLDQTREQIQELPAFADASRWTDAPVHSRILPGTIEHIHSDGYYSLQFSFLVDGGPAVMIEFRRSRNSTIAGRLEIGEVHNILRHNGGLHSWTRVPYYQNASSAAESTGTSAKMWRRNDGALAYYRGAEALVLEAPAAFGRRPRPHATE